MRILQFQKPLFGHYKKIVTNNSSDEAQKGGILFANNNKILEPYDSIHDLP